MREIKFRAWIPKWGMWNSIYAIYLRDNRPVSIEVSSPELKSEVVFIEDDQVVLMQSTGLKDKHGVEIYESDLVKSVWCDCPEGTEHEVDFEDACSYAGKHRLEEFEWQVIGNIHKNPELLKGGKI